MPWRKITKIKLQINLDLEAGKFGIIGTSVKKEYLHTKVTRQMIYCIASGVYEKDRRHCACRKKAL